MIEDAQQVLQQKPVERWQLLQHPAEGGSDGNRKKINFKAKREVLSVAGWFNKAMELLLLFFFQRLCNTVM